MAVRRSSSSRKRVDAAPSDAATTGPSLVRAKDGSAFARWCVFLSIFSMDVMVCTPTGWRAKEDGVTFLNLCNLFSLCFDFYVG